MPVLSPELQPNPADEPPCLDARTNDAQGVAPSGLGLGARLRAAVEQAGEALDALAGRPWTFLLALLAINALILPYASFRQDARLYALQVLNVLEEGRFAEDLFFLYGSQDRYSLFSLVAAPLLRVTGIPVGFFLLYLIGNALFLGASLRFLKVLLPNRLVAAWGVIYLAVTCIPFGGVETFHVGENFFTPRLSACALVLFGLEHLLRGRLTVAAAWLLAAFLLHPLMALGGWLVFLGWVLVQYLPPRWVIGTLGGLAALTVGVLLYEPLAVRLLGRMDAEWYELIRRVNPYQIVFEWSWLDWLRLAVAGAVAAGAWACPGQTPSVQRFLGLLLAVGLLGVGGTMLACGVPYALPLQAQPYRVLWLLQMLQTPLSLYLLWQWRTRADVPAWILAVAGVGCLTLLPLDLSAWLPFLVAAGLFVLGHWIKPNARARGPAWPSVARCVWVGLGAWALLQAGVIIRHWHQVSGLLDPMEFPRALSQQLNPLTRLLAGAGLVLLAARRLGHGPRLQGSLAALWLLVQVGSFAIPLVPSYADRFQPHRADLLFVKDHLNHGRAADKPLTVYWPHSCVEYLWQDLRVNCYFNVAQLSGNSFARGTALEGERRLGLVRPFEIDCYRRLAFMLADIPKHILREVLQADLDGPMPTRADLDRLCQDTVLDFVIILQRFDGLYAATNGTWFLYDCRDVRATVQNHGPGGSASVQEKRP